MRPGEFMCLGLGMQSHHRTFGRNDFAALTLDASDLSRAAMDLTGRDLAVTAGKVILPPDHLGTWLLSVIDAATRAGQATPGIFASQAAADALQQALLRPMIRCLMDGEARNEGVPRGHRAVIAKKFAAAVEARSGWPVAHPRPLSDGRYNGADAEHPLPGTARRVGATVPRAATVAPDATQAAPVRPSFRNGHGDRNQLRNLGTRAICRGLQVAVRGIAVIHTAPAARIIADNRHTSRDHVG